MNDGGVCRTGPATPGLLMMILILLRLIIMTTMMIIMMMINMIMIMIIIMMNDECLLPAVHCNLQAGGCCRWQLHCRL